MKKILFVIPTLEGGGAERILVDIYNSAKNEPKLSVHILSIFNQGVFKNDINDFKNFHYIFPRKIMGFSKILNFFPLGFVYKYFGPKIKFDIIISYLEGPSARIVSGIESNTKKYAWIHTDQKTRKGSIEGFRNYKEAYKCYSMFNNIICVSELVKTSFEKNFPNIKTKIIYNPINADKIINNSMKHIDSTQSIKNNVINFVSTGRLISVKGYDRLLRVHKNLLDAGFKHTISIIGEGKERSKLLSEIKKFKVEKSFFLLGFYSNPYPYLKQYDVFVCSSRREGYSTSVTEALILGLPVISTYCSGATELLGENNEYGLVVDNSEQGLFESMQLIIKNPNKLDSLREKAFLRGQELIETNNLKTHFDFLLKA